MKILNYLCVEMFITFYKTNDMGSKTTKKYKKRKGKNRFDLSDERIGKIIGVLFILISVYLCIAFTSYFFTWQADQDKVLNFSFNILFNGDIVVSNWLGRLGALVSNGFFYWGFGLSSVFFVIIFFNLGFSILLKRKLFNFFNFLIYSFYGIAFVSIALEFILRDSAFSWGGAFGEAINIWLSNFIGSVGLLLLLV